MRPLRILVACLVVGGVSPVLGTDYYVATDGSDANAGTEQLPWRTVQKAATTMIAGDTVYIRQGTYVEHVLPVNAGADDAYITYQAFPGEQAVIESPNTWGSDYCILLPEARDLHHLRFRDLTLRGANWANFYASASAAGPKSHLELDGLSI